MAVDFLTETQKSQYGQFYAEPNDVQLVRYFYLDATDLGYIAQRRGAQNKLGFALQITTVRFLGTFLTDMSQVPIGAQDFVAKQLSISDLSVAEEYAQRETTLREHKAIIRRDYGYHDFGSAPWGFRLSRYLYTRAWISNERPSLMFDYATAWLIRNKVLLPGATTLTRLISTIRERADAKLWKSLASLASDQQKLDLESLLHVPEDMQTSRFDNFRKGPVRASSPAFIRALARYRELRAFGIGHSTSPVSHQAV